MDAYQLDNVLVSQKDRLLTEINLIDYAPAAVAEFSVQVERCNVILEKLGFVAGLWREADYAYKLQEIGQRLRDVFNRLNDEARHYTSRQNAVIDLQAKLANIL